MRCKERPGKTQLHEFRVVSQRSVSLIVAYKVIQKMAVNQAVLENFVISAGLLCDHLQVKILTKGYPECQLISCILC